jgi:AAA domain, putative AbiEii toxin, Type IV TA system
MRINSIGLKGFRSYKDELINIQPDLTTFVGENNVGKSSVGLALSKVIASCIANGNQITKEDYPYGHKGLLLIDVIIEFTDDELWEMLVPLIIPNDLVTNSTIKHWVAKQGNQFRILQEGANIPVVTWNNLNIFGPHISRNKIDSNKGGSALYDILRKSVAQYATSEHIDSIFTEQYTIAGIFSQNLGNLCSKQYKMSDEFRMRPNKHQRGGGVIESWNGIETANVLLTLKNHVNSSERQRYKEVQNAFHTLFPHYTIEAVESGPGNNTPDVQFCEEGRIEYLSLDQVSSGVIEILTLVTNLISRKGFVVFLDHPELHLHPHALKWMKSFLFKYSEHNQIIVVTHDPYLIEPKGILGIRRFWWIPGEGTKVCSVNSPLNEVELAQIKTAMRNVGDREVFFARAVLLVEDESLMEFLVAVATTLGYDLNANGISIIYVGGHGGHRPFHVLLNNLGIPHINLRDKSWGNNPDFPPDKFLSLGCEFEEYIDSQGLSDIRKEIAKQAGPSHRRQAVLLGEKLNRSQIPSIFDNMLKQIINVATGKPA